MKSGNVGRTPDMSIYQAQAKKGKPLGKNETVQNDSVVLGENGDLSSASLERLKARHKKRPVKTSALQKMAKSARGLFLALAISGALSVGFAPKASAAQSPKQETKIAVTDENASQAAGISHQAVNPNETPSVQSPWTLGISGNYQGKTDGIPDNSKESLVKHKVDATNKAETELAKSYIKYDGVEGIDIDSREGHVALVRGIEIKPEDSLDFRSKGTEAIKVEYDVSTGQPREMTRTMDIKDELPLTEQTRLIDGQSKVVWNADGTLKQVDETRKAHVNDTVSTNFGSTIQRVQINQNKNGVTSFKAENKTVLDLFPNGINSSPKQEIPNVKSPWTMGISENYKGKSDGVFNDSKEVMTQNKINGIAQAEREIADKFAVYDNVQDVDEDAREGHVSVVNKFNITPEDELDFRSKGTEAVKLEFDTTTGTPKEMTRTIDIRDEFPRTDQVRLVKGESKVIWNADGTLKQVDESRTTKEVANFGEKRTQRVQIKQDGSGTSHYTQERK